MSSSAIGEPLPRVDGHAKVMGGARYAADFTQDGLAYAVIVAATVGLGRVAGINAAPVLAMPGVLAVISHNTSPRLPYSPHKGSIDPAIGERLHVLLDAGLVTEQRAGRERLYSLQPDRLRSVRDWLRTYEHFWHDRLASLGDYLDEEQSL